MRIKPDVGIPFEVLSKNRYSLRLVNSTHATALQEQIYLRLV